MTTRQQKIKKIRQLCDRVTYQELESMDAKRLHSLNCNLLMYGLEMQYEHVFREAQKIQRRKIAGPPSPPGLSSLIFSFFSSEEKSEKKLSTGKIMKDSPQQEQENKQEESFLVRKGSKHEKRPYNL